MDPNELIQRYLIGEATEAEVQELDRLLAKDPDLRKKLIFEAGNDAGLREIAMERMAEPEAIEEKIVTPSFRPIAWSVAACAAVMLAIFASSRPQQPATVATLVSNEDAAWESALPTTPGSELAAGTLSLKSGLSTIRFESGAEVVLEAPAQLELIDSMRCRLVSGAAIIEAPESAIGFVMETPNGYAVDYGTRFAVEVDKHGGASHFELIDGEIAVHEPATGASVSLSVQGKKVVVSDQKILLADTELAPVDGDDATVVRVYTRRKTGSATRRKGGKKQLHKDFLYAKHSASGKWDHRSFFSFDYSEVDLDQVASVRLRLNLVPNTKRMATRLPKINRFAIHGLTNPAKEDWQRGVTWDESPGPEDGLILGTFEIPRSQQQGSFSMDDDRLLEFLRTQRAKERVTLILTRETGQITGTWAGPSPPHKFASASHPEAVGPILEFTLKQ